MSPAPYPPLHAGDDVDADFFDQLGDELDFPPQEAVPHKHQDAGLANLADSTGEFLSSGAGTWRSISEVHEEEVGCHPPQEGNSHVDSELEDAFSDLHLGTQDAESISYSTADTLVLENDDDHGFDDPPAEVEQASEPRVNGSNSSLSGSIPSSLHPEDNNSGVQSGGGEDSVASTFVPSNTVNEDTVGLDPKLCGQLSFSLGLPETSSTTEELDRCIMPKDDGGVKLAEPSKVQAQTTKVQEVQWSNFGEQGGFGSFSDFLSEFPSESSELPHISGPAPSTHGESFHFSVQSTLHVPSNIVEQQYNDVSFFDRQQPLGEVEKQTVQMPPQPSATMYLPQAQVQSGERVDNVQGLETQVQSALLGADQNFQSLGQEQQVQGDQLDHSEWNNLQSEEGVQQTQFGQLDQGPWRELAEYPGWLYNTLTGEWVEKNNHDGTGTASWNVTSGQNHTQDRAGEGEISQWQGYEGTGVTLEGSGFDNDSHLGQSTAPIPANEWTGEQNITGQTNITHNPLFEESVVQQRNEPAWQESTGEFGSSQLQVGWEDQYPGWYYDHNAQEWKQYDQPSQTFAVSAPQLPEEQPLSTSLPAFSYQPTAYSNSLSQVYHTDGRSTGQDQQDSGRGHYFPDAPGSFDVVPGSSWNETPSSNQAHIGQWASDQQPIIPTNQYNPYAAPHMPGYPSQPWSSWNSYENSHYPQYIPQTPPKSVEEARKTSVGRPPHVLMSFGFGGKLVIMKLKDPLSLHSSDGSQSVASGQAFVPGPINVHSLSQVVSQTVDNGRGEMGTLFAALSRPAFNGPLVGGSFSNKDLFKWLDDQTANCQSEEPNFTSPGALPMLWGLLKLACKHYGKLRSQTGSAGITSQEEDGAEAALATLLTSGGVQSSWTMGSFSSTVCLQPLPSEHQLQVTASETKRLLVAGKRMEALKNAQQGQLWGPALVLSRQLGEKYYAATVAEMAQRQFLPGSPLRTLSLLLAGQPAEVFSGNSDLAVPSKQPIQMPSSSGTITEGGLGSMLDEWQENLSIMAANRTNGDDRVISHLGDCLWKVKGEVAAAHICYLVADANFEYFSSNARLCLVGADHWKNPRTYATPEAIQRTEVYEYSKFLGNPQFILVPFQPYKLIYASMLVEAGKPAEALRYCQAVLKTLKTASRAPEVETCRLAAASLEARLRCYMQGGSAVNLAPQKLVSGFLSALDRGIHRIIGGPPPPNGQEHLQIGATVESAALQDDLAVPRFASIPSRSPTPLGPSASAEKLKESSRPMPQRSVSEPDFSTTMKEKAEQGKPTARGSYLGRFGSVFSKAGGIVNRVSKKNEAKLGDTNKFYYDEKLKRWVEEGAAAVQEEAALPPPPTSANFMGKADDLAPTDVQFGAGPGTAPASASKNTYMGTPPVPPSNQFSARARQQGVRSRYVDTFNKLGNSTTPSKPAVSAFAPAGRVAGTPLQPLNFFVPGSSVDTSNGSAFKSENGSARGISEENHSGHHPEQISSMQERMDAANQSGMFSSGNLGPSSENSSAFVTGAMHQVPSSDYPTAFGAGESAEASGGSGMSPSNGDVGFSNGYHSRANSWSGYPSNFQTSQIESNSSYDNPSTNFSMYNGFSSQSAMNTPPSVGSYFPSPPKVDIYNPNASGGMIDTFTSPPPSMPPFTSAVMGGELRPGAMEARDSSQARLSFVGDDLQEVEL